MANKFKSVMQLVRREGLSSLFSTKFYSNYIRTRLAGARPFEWDMASLAAQDLESTDLIGALELHRVLTRIQPSPAFHYRFGAALARAGNLEAATASLRTAVELEPQTSVFRQKLFTVTCQHLGPDEALAIEDSLPPMDHSAHGDLARTMAIALFANGSPQRAYERHPTFFGESCLGVQRSDTVKGKYSVELAVADQAFTLIIPNDFLDWAFLIDRLFVLVPWLVRAIKDVGGHGRVRISLGDFPDGDQRQLGFCGPQGVTHLIPDPNFLASNGYADFRRLSDHHPRRFDKRIPRAYWRGSLTGMADTYDEIMQLPRVQLALMGRFHDSIDAKITDLSQFGPLLPTLEHMMLGLDVLGSREDNAENLNYKYLIDVDGNTNSWPGLFTKLLSRSVVIKLASSHRQWFYDRLRDGENYVRIQNLSEIERVVAQMEGDPRRAAALGEAAYRLAASMTCETEYATIREEVGAFMR